MDQIGAKLSFFILILSTQLFPLTTYASIFSIESNRGYLSSFFSWSEFKIDIKEKSEKTLNEDQYFIFTHASNIWDFERSSLNGVKKMISFAKNSSIKRIALMNIKSSGDGVISDFTQEGLLDYYYFSPDQIDTVVASKSGGHNLNFSKTKKVFLAGGYLNQCLCETIRDIIYVKGKYTFTNLKFYIVKDAVYNRDHSLRTHVYNLESQFISNLQSSNNKANYFISNNYAGQIQDCWQQHIASSEIEKTSIRFFLDKEYIYSFSSRNKEYYFENDFSQNNHGKIEIHFIHSDDLHEYTEND